MVSKSFMIREILTLKDLLTSSYLRARGSQHPLLFEGLLISILTYHWALIITKSCLLKCITSITTPFYLIQFSSVKVYFYMMCICLTGNNIYILSNQNCIVYSVDRFLRRICCVFRCQSLFKFFSWYLYLVCKWAVKF